MEFPKLSTIDKAFLVVLAGILSVGIMIQAGSGFSGVDNTFGVDPTGEGYVEVYDLNVSRDWFRGLVNVTDRLLGVWDINQIMEGANMFYFRDTDIYIASLNDGFFDIEADAWIRINAPTRVSSTVLLDQEITGSTANSPDLILRGNYWNGTHNLGVEAYWRLIGGNNPFVQMWVDDDADSSTPVNIMNIYDSFMYLRGPFYPTTPNVFDLGAASVEWQDLYLGTGRAHFYTDQGEYIYSDGTSLFLGASGGNIIDIASGVVTVNTRILTSVIDLEDASPRISWWDTDKTKPEGWFRISGSGNILQLASRNAANNAWETIIAYERIAAGGLVAFQGSDGIMVSGDIDLVGNTLKTNVNNTGAIGEDAVRIANAWFTTMTAKSSVTGSVVETEISPAPWESFEEGDVVKIYDSEYFVKTSKKLDYVVGVVIDNPQQVIDHYDITWEMVEEQIPLTEEVEYILNTTDAYGNNFTVVETRMEEVYEHYLNPVEEMLFNGSKIMIYYNESRIVYETVYENVTTETPIFVEEGSPVLCVAGVTKVKIIEPVFKNDILVAGPNGIARPFRVVINEIKANYGGIPFNWNNVLEVIENFNMRTLGQVMEDSDGNYCQVMLW